MASRGEAFGFAGGRPGLGALLGYALVGHLRVGRVQLDTEPVAAVLLSGKSRGAGAHERVEHQAGNTFGSALTSGLEFAHGEQPPVSALQFSLPGATA